MAPADPTPAAVEAALASIARDGYAATRARMLAALKGFCVFLVRHGYLDDDPSADPRLRRPPSSCRGRSPTMTSAG